MQSIGPRFLHQPLPTLNWQIARDAALWLAEGMRFWLPKFVSGRGWASSEKTYLFGADERLSLTGVVERSWAGESRTAEISDASLNLPRTVVLDRSLIYDTILELPTEARNNVHRAVELRLNDISPLPPRDIAFAVGPIKKVSNRRIAVQIALVRRTHLDQIVKEAPSRRISKVITCGESGHVFTFFEGRSIEFSSLRVSAITIAALYFSVVALGISITHRGESRLASLNAHDNELRQAIAKMRSENEWMEDARAASPTAILSSDLMGMMSNALTALPESVVVESITLKDGKLSITALTPQDEELSTPFVIIRREKSDYQNYYLVELSFSHAPEESHAS